MWPDTLPVLLVSAAYGLRQIAAQLQAMGVKAHLTKPFDVDLLARTVEELVRLPVMAA